MKLFSFGAVATLVIASVSNAQVADPPKNYGILLFPAFEALDVFGPLDALNLLSLQRQLSLSLIAKTLDPVSTKPMAAAMNRFNSSFGESVLPTHTLADPPTDIEVLIVPGGPGTRNPNITSEISFVGQQYPRLKYLITICTGAGIAARSGVMDGKRATTNKAAYNQTTALRPQVNWVPKARWVVDGNIWSSSGVAAGTDATLAFISKVHGEDTALRLANGMEYERHTDPSWDPFSDLYGLS